MRMDDVTISIIYLAGEIAKVLVLRASHEVHVSFSVIFRNWFARSNVYEYAYTHSVAFSNRRISHNHDDYTCINNKGYYTQLRQSLRN